MTEYNSNPFHSGDGQNPDALQGTPRQGTSYPVAGRAPQEENIATYPATSLPTGQPGQVGQAGAHVQQKSRAVAALLAFFLGGLGIHQFYVGNVALGTARIGFFLLSLLTALFGVGIFLAVCNIVWSIIDIILVLARAGYMATDKRGVPLK